ncbi:MAG: methylated-DNA--[protein]-cysteine S-methyltransferase [Pseudomonadota bacterium]
MPQLSLHSPLGDLSLTEEDGVLVALDWGWGRDQTPTPLLRRAVHQLHDYFDERRRQFEVPLYPHGTPFQRRLWAALEAIPYGETRSYQALARLLGSSPRAIGQACGANPLPILIPCHRVLAADGRLGGYSGEGGVETKIALLRLEGALL